MSSDQKASLSFNYSDRFSTLLLWWKAFFMVPVWGYVILPFLGSIVAFFGLLNFTYVAVMLSSIVYFVDDVLKRKFRIDDKYITHGLRTRDLTKLLSIGTGYKRNEVLPKRMILTFSEGKSMEFRLSRVNSPDYQKFLKFIESNYPQCQIDPVLQTLINCKKVARKVLVDDGDKFIIEYRSEQILLNLWRAFMDTAYPWLRIGPLFVAFLSAPWWLSGLENFLFMPISWTEKNKAEEMTRAWATYMSNLTNSLFTTAGDTGKHVMEVLGHPIIAAVSMFILLYLLVSYTVKLLFRPNSLIIDKNGLTLAVSAFGNTLSSDRIKWDSVLSVGMERTNEAKAKIRFNMQKGKPFDLDFSSVLPNDRPRLAKALERFAPRCSIDSALSEAMMPKHERSYTELWLQSLSTPTERNSLQTLTPGQRLQNDQYLVVCRLGVGGQGTAYLCRDEVNKCEVVLKETVIPVFADRVIKEQALKRFEQEAKLLQSLDNGHIVRLSDYFFEDHRGYLVLEHITGKNLRQLVQDEGCLSEDRVRDLANQMCEILLYLHGHEIIHRDFTPDNLILNADGTLKLIDFNVAQSMQVGTTGTIAGKHAYLPPEQFRGKATQQSDIYAMGATLFFLLTGKDPEPISQSSPLKAGASVSSDLDAVVRDCTAIDCSKRYNSTETVKERLGETKLSSITIAEEEGSYDAGDDTTNGAKIDTRESEREVCLEKAVEA